MNKNLKTWTLRGLFCGAVFALAFLVAQVATYTTLAQFPTASPGGSLNFASDALMFAFNADSHGTRQWFLSQPISKPPLTGWTLDDGIGSSTFDTTYGYPFITSSNGTPNDRLACIYRTAPAAPYTMKVLLQHQVGTPSTGAATIGGYGVAFGDAGGKYVTFLYEYNNTTAWPSNLLADTKWSASTTAVANYTSSGAVPTMTDSVTQNPRWIVVADNNTNLIFYQTTDGNHLQQFDSRARTDYLTSPTRIAVCAYSETASANIAVLSFSAQ